MARKVEGFGGFERDGFEGSGQDRNLLPALRFLSGSVRKRLLLVRFPANRAAVGVGRMGVIFFHWRMLWVLMGTDWDRDWGLRFRVLEDCG